LYIGEYPLCFLDASVVKAGGAHADVRLVAGTKLGLYEVGALIGAGGMGEVYQATGSRPGRSVAIKLLPAAFSQDGEQIARFGREARVLASLNHPNIAAIYGLEESAGQRFLVMELVPGGTLSEKIKRGQGGAWGRDGVILFAAHVISGLLRVPAAGGTPTSVTHPRAG
jgi:serine/threonine protein kinase